MVINIRFVFSVNVPIQFVPMLHIRPAERGVEGRKVSACKEPLKTRERLIQLTKDPNTLLSKSRSIWENRILYLWTPNRVILEIIKFLKSVLLCLQSRHLKPFKKQIWKSKYYPKNRGTIQITEWIQNTLNRYSRNSD